MVGWRERCTYTIHGADNICYYGADVNLAGVWPVGPHASPRVMLRSRIGGRMHICTPASRFVPPKCILNALRYL